MEFLSVILTILFAIVVVLFAFCMTESRGKNTPHARKNNADRPAEANPQQTIIENNF